MRSDLSSVNRQICWVVHRLTALFFFAALSACGGLDESSTLELHCRGDETIDAQPTSSATRSYRIDLQSSTLEVWNPKTAQFVKWGNGSVSTTREIVAFTGELGLVDSPITIQRRIELNRSSMQIRDHVDASWGSAIEFNGVCTKRRPTATVARRLRVQQSDRRVLRRPTKAASITSSPKLPASMYVINYGGGKPAQMVLSSPPAGGRGRPNPKGRRVDVGNRAQLDESNPPAAPDLRIITDTGHLAGRALGS